MSGTFSRYSRTLGFRCLSESITNVVEMHFECGISPFRIQTLTQSHPGNTSMPIPLVLTEDQCKAKSDGPLHLFELKSQTKPVKLESLTDFYRQYKTSQLLHSMHGLARRARRYQYVQYTGSDTRTNQTSIQCFELQDKTKPVSPVH